MYPDRDEDREPRVYNVEFTELAKIADLMERIANTLQRLQHVVDLAYRQGWGSPPIRRD